MVDKKVVSAWVSEDLYHLLKSKVKEIRRAGARDITVSSLAGSILGGLYEDIEALDPEKVAKDILEGVEDVEQPADGQAPEGGEAEAGQEAERQPEEENPSGEDEGAEGSEESRDEVVQE